MNHIWRKIKTIDMAVDFSLQIFIPFHIFFPSKYCVGVAAIVEVHSRCLLTNEAYYAHTIPYAPHKKKRV